MFEQQASQGRDAFVKGMRLSHEALYAGSLFAFGREELNDTGGHI